ncbi:MAG: microcin C ABC transporter permease YejB [Rhodobacteraceae bacterium]|nr:microcin C ABC transporter permease YejB [Paracoccaceae bacterium]
MGAYIFRRLLLIIPTLFGIMAINFALVQFVPGGPIDQIISNLEGQSDGFDLLGGSNADAGISGRSVQMGASAYKGARGLSEDFIRDLEIQFGFDKPPLTRFWLMMKKYITFDFGESYFRSVSVMDLVLEKMPVSITLGLWSTVIAYMIALPLGIKKAVREGSRFDSWTTAILVAAYAIPTFLFAVMLVIVFAGGSYFQWFPLRGLTSSNFSDLTVMGKMLDYLWHIFLPVLAGSIGGFTTLSLLTKNSFLDEIKKQYVITARAKGLPERRILYGHVFRNAMLIIIASFPGIFIGVFFGGSLFIETIFSLDGLGRMGFEATISRDYPIMFATIYVFTLLGLLVKILSDLTYVWIDPRIDFGNRQS